MATLCRQNQQSAHPLQALEPGTQDRAVLLGVVLIVAGFAALADQLVRVRPKQVHVLLHLHSGAASQLGLFADQYMMRNEAHHKVGSEFY